MGIMRNCNFCGAQLEVHTMTDPYGNTTKLYAYPGTQMKHKCDPEVKKAFQASKGQYQPQGQPQYQQSSFGQNYPEKAAQAGLAPQEGRVSLDQVQAMIDKLKQDLMNQLVDIKNTQSTTYSMVGAIIPTIAKGFEEMDKRIENVIKALPPPEIVTADKVKEEKKQ